MMTHDTKGKLSIAAVFFLPLVLVKGTSMLFVQGGLRTATATTINITPVPPPVLKGPGMDWTPEQIAAARHIDKERHEPYGPTPLFHQERKDTGGIIETIPKDLPPPPVHSVQMILTSRSGNVALINRKRYHVGDALGNEGWFVAEIDSESRAVHLEHPETKRTHPLRVPLPR